eukprot:5041659-Pleurochrysis_carterae.AAC.1
MHVWTKCDGQIVETTRPGDVPSNVGSASLESNRSRWIRRESSQDAVHGPNEANRFGASTCRQQVRLGSAHISSNVRRRTSRRLESGCSNLRHGSSQRFRRCERLRTGTSPCGAFPDHHSRTELNEGPGHLLGKALSNEA